MWRGGQRRDDEAFLDACRSRGGRRGHVRGGLTGEFLRVKEGGEISDRIPLDGRIALACVLGGPDRRTLFMMTAAPHDLGVLKVKKTDGAILKSQVSVPGAGRP